jgi:MraZ protein
MEYARLPEGFKPLVGIEAATIDDKGRVLFNKKKRERLGDNFAIVVTKRGCLAAYPAVIWQRMLENVFSYEDINDGREEYTRLFFSLSDDDLNFDGQGRVVIPKELRDFCKLKKDVKLIGAGDRIEIWAVEEYSSFLNDKVHYAEDRRKEMIDAYEAMVGK